MGWFYTTNFNDPSINSNQNQTGFGVSYAQRNTLFSANYDVITQAQENIKTLLLTRSGERVMTGFGTDLLSILFQPNISSLKSIIDTTIRDAVNTFLPRINITNINILTNEDDPTLIHDISIKIDFLINNSVPAAVNLTVSGTVVEVSGNGN
jgi:phage baseplate assembly protein W